MHGRKSLPDGLSRYRFAGLDPRDVDGSGAANRDLLGPCTLGVEVTVPSLAAGCGRGNIDPQHHQLSDGGQAAIEAALDWPLPPPGSTLTTIRPDLDSLGAMAVLGMRAEGEPLGRKIRRRIEQIAQADRHDCGAWPGPRPIAAALAERAPLAPLAIAVADAGRDLDQRVALLRHWLIEGTVPTAYCRRAAAARRDLVAAVMTGSVRMRTLCGGRIAGVVGNRPAALRLGYCLAPVVIALNPEFHLGGGPPHSKFTVAQYRAGYADFAPLRTALGALEPGWGGSATILGSPQGAASRLSLCTVAREVRRVSA